MKEEEINRKKVKEAHFIWDYPQFVYDLLLKNNWVCLIVMFEKEIDSGEMCFPYM